MVSAEDNRVRPNLQQVLPRTHSEFVKIMDYIGLYCFFIGDVNWYKVKLIWDLQTLYSWVAIGTILLQSRIGDKDWRQILETRIGDASSIAWKANSIQVQYYIQFIYRHRVVKSFSSQIQIDRYILENQKTNILLHLKLYCLY